MKSTILAFALGLALGAALTFWILQPRQIQVTEDLQLALDARDAVIANLEARLPTTENVENRSIFPPRGIEPPQTALKNPLLPAPPNPPDNIKLAEMGAALTRSELSQEADKTLISLTRRLNLTAEQEEKLAGFLDAKREMHLKLTTRMLSGEMPTQEEMKQEAQFDSLSQDRFMEDLLSPDQLAGYQEHREDQNHAAREQIAQHELTTMNELFPMSEQQKDAVFAALVDSRSLPPAGISRSGDPIEFMDNQQVQRTEFLRRQLTGILPVDDLELWLEHEEKTLSTQRELLKQFIPGK